MDKQKILGVKAAIKYKENPFLSGTDNMNPISIKKGKKQTTIGISPDKFIVDAETGEIDGSKTFAILQREEVDKEEFVKLYIGQLKQIMGLSNTALKAFGYVCETLKINEGEVYINVHRLREYANWSNSAPAYKALAELISKGIIAPSINTNIWFVNPSVVFNGNRIVWYHEYFLKKSKINSLNPKQTNPRQTELFSDNTKGK